MSDESDETRISPSSDPSSDPSGSASSDPSGSASRQRRLDDTVADGPSARDDATRTGPHADDATQIAPRVDGPGADDATRVAPQVNPADDATRVAPRADSTSVMPPTSDEWAAGRTKPVWSGRAEVRPPQPGRTGYDVDWSDAPPPPPPGSGRGDRWWMPIVVGFVVLVMLGVLAWAIYLIVQNSGDDQTPATTPSTVATTATTTEPSSAPTTEPSSAPTTEPTTTEPTTEPTTTEPTATEVLVPALKGLSLADARAALNRTGLRYRVLYRDSTAPPGTVIDSDPEEGQEVPPDTRVTIVVSQEGGATTTPTTTATTTPAAGD
jgi:hypothetical protein